MDAAPAAIPESEHAARRARLLESLGESVAVLFAGDPAGHGDHGDWRPHPHFEYFTGVTDEPGAVLVLDPTHPVEARRAALFLRPLDPELERWDGHRMEIGQPLRRKVGMQTVFRTTGLARFLAEAMRRTRVLACLHPLAWHDQPVSPDLALFRRISERVPDARIVDRTDLPNVFRSVKSDAEVAMIRRAIAITAESLADAAPQIRPGTNEFAVQARLEHGYRARGSRGPAYGSIVGSGFNSTVLHYRANAKDIEAGDLVCIDSGARWGGYGADITRTFPAGGTFSSRQRTVYDIVLAALHEGTAAVRPGATIAQIDAAARLVIARAGFADAFIHGIGHHLGLETHDANPDRPLEPGCVITIEPGIYLPDERLGIRIEDDILVTPDGHENLSAAIPRDATDIEAMVGGP